jgi:hypothetical protein
VTAQFRGDGCRWQPPQCQMINGMSSALEPVAVDRLESIPRSAS